jgi:hypothetical protein
VINIEQRNGTAQVGGSCCFGLPIEAAAPVGLSSADECHRSVNDLSIDAISSPLE